MAVSFSLFPCRPHENEEHVTKSFSSPRVVWNAHMPPICRDLARIHLFPEMRVYFGGCTDKVIRFSGSHRKSPPLCFRNWSPEAPGETLASRIQGPWSLHPLSGGTPTSDSPAWTAGFHGGARYPTVFFQTPGAPQVCTEAGRSCWLRGVQMHQGKHLNTGAGRVEMCCRSTHWNEHLRN